MGRQKKKPEEYGIRVRNDSIDLGITAANKSRNTKKMVYRTSDEIVKEQESSVAAMPKAMIG